MLLTSRKVRERAQHAERRAREAAEREQEAYRAWEAGLVVPDRITTALDAAGLDGPEVDLACGVEEPAVDRWEAGILYLSWEELVALAELTGYPVGFFVQPVTTVITPWDTSLRFHAKLDPADAAPPVLAFTPGALAAFRAGTVPHFPEPDWREATFEQILIPLALPERRR